MTEMSEEQRYWTLCVIALALIASGTILGLAYIGKMALEVIAK